MVEQFALHGAAAFYLFLYTRIDLFPESGHTRHAGGVLLAHGLLHFQRIGVNYQPCTDRNAENLPALFKNMSKRQEVQNAVVLINRHTLAIGLHCCMVLPAGQDNTLRIAGGTAGIQDIGDVVHRGLRLQSFYFSLTRQIVAQCQKVVEVHSGGVAFCQPHATVEDDNPLQRLTGAKHAPGFVILFLFAHEKEANAGIVQHELYLLFRAGSIERYRNGTNAPCTEIAEQILHGIL